MLKTILGFLLIPTFAFAGDHFISERQNSMQDFNKNMRLANQMINEGQIDDDLANVYEKIENIMKEYPTLFPDSSFKGRTKASIDIIDNRDAFNEIALKAQEWASLAKIGSQNNDIELVQQNHQNLFSSCKSCHSRFKD